MSRENLLNIVGATKRDTEPRDRVSELEAKLDALTTYTGLTVKEVSDGVYEVIKEVVSSGDYTDPILFVPPMNIEEGKWYYAEAIGKDMPREAIADGNMVTDFDNDMIFEWV